MAAGDTAKTTRAIIQRMLLGPVGEFGDGNDSGGIFSANDCHAGRC